MTWKSFFLLFHFRHQWKIELSAVIQEKDKDFNTTLFVRKATWICTRCDKTFVEDRWAFVRGSGALHGFGNRWVKTERATTITKDTPVFNMLR